MTEDRVPRIAIVEDDSLLAFMLDESCKSCGFDVVGCERDAEGALELIEREKPDLLLLDFALEGDSNGLELIAEIRSRSIDVFIILVTAWDINDIASRMSEAQPDRILRKPVAPHVLQEVIEHALQPAEHRDPALSSLHHPSRVVGRPH